jgi:hypothetical protein
MTSSAASRSARSASRSRTGSPIATRLTPIDRQPAPRAHGDVDARSGVRLGDRSAAGAAPDGAGAPRPAPRRSDPRAGDGEAQAALPLQRRRADGRGGVGMFTAAITTPAPNAASAGHPAEPAGRHRRRRSATTSSATARCSASRPARSSRRSTRRGPTRLRPFVVAVCRQIGAGLGIPYELLIMQFTASYSASRGALLEAWKRFKVGRAWLAAGLCQPSTSSGSRRRWRADTSRRRASSPIRSSARPGAAPSGTARRRVSSTRAPKSRPRQTRVENGFSTRTQETRELTGGDFWSNERLRAREEEARKKDGLAIEPRRRADPPAKQQTGPIRRRRQRENLEPHRFADDDGRKHLDVQIHGVIDGGWLDDLDVDRRDREGARRAPDAKKIERTSTASAAASSAASRCTTSSRRTAPR